MKNRMSKVMSIVLVLGMLLSFMVVVVGCGEQQADEEKPVEETDKKVEDAARYPLIITDSAGRTITLEEPVKRVVALTSRVAETMRMFGIEDKLIGVTDSIIEAPKQFPALVETTSVGSGFRPCVETVLYLKPDVLFTWVKRPDPEQLRKAELEAVGIKVIRLDLYRAGALLEEIRVLGEIFDREKEAEAYISWHDKYINLVKERVAAIPQDEKVRVFAESDGAGKSPGTRRAMGAGAGIQELITIAGGINIAADIIAKTSGEVETEWLLTENPDVIIGREMRRAGGFETDDPADMREHYNEIKGLPGFATEVKAVINGRVYIVSSDVLGGPPLPVGALYLAKWFYPEKFADIDPQAVHQEYIDMFWLGVGYDVRTEGVFVYPPQE